jgi:hypothetical protein
MPSEPRRRKTEADHPDALAARDRVSLMIDAIPPADLVEAIKRAPSLRGMILGYVAEEVFEKFLRDNHKEVTEIEKHDDHDRSKNKSDRTITYKDRKYTVQLKSLQTNSIKYFAEGKCLVAVVQNDGSDKRAVDLPDGTTIQTTLYRRGDYDILAVPLFPFTGKWEFAYKRNRDCRPCTHSAYTPEAQAQLLASTESITYPLDKTWTTDLISLLDDTLGTAVTVDEAIEAASEKGAKKRETLARKLVLTPEQMQLAKRELKDRKK